METEKERLPMPAGGRGNEVPRTADLTAPVSELVPLALTDVTLPDAEILTVTVTRPCFLPARRAADAMRLRTCDP